MADFYGRPVGVLENEFLRLEYLLESGPRIVRLFFKGSTENLLAEMPDSTIPTPYGEYNFMGGHRLWHAPEQLPRTYVPDSAGLEVQASADNVRLVQPVEAPTGIRKSMKIRLQPGKPVVTIEHKLENGGAWTVELAAWAITQLRLGGVAVMPQQLPSDPVRRLLPDRLLAIWAYTKLSDPRLHLHNDVILVDGLAAQPPCKIGVMNRRGWTGYLYKDIFFNKRFTLCGDDPQPDFGCNNEIYVDHRFIEVETLGPLKKLEPGQSVVHTETWELTGGLDYPATVAGVRAMAVDLKLNEAELLLAE
ncbi:MAG TPA: hypothetical protein VF813_07035 [Anaerolineaceae bacterium]